MFSSRIKNLHPYIPGEQPTDREYIKLNANENPFLPHPKVLEAICQATKNPALLSRYPDPDANELRSAIANFLNKTGGVLCTTQNENGKIFPQNDLGFTITPEMIFCGNGSDEVLSFVFYTFFDSSVPLVLPEFTYSFYPVYCGYYGISQNKIPLKNDWTLDTEKIVAEAKKTKSPIVFANPNAPTGKALSNLQIKAILEQLDKNQVLVVDEAYADFADESCICLLKDFENLIVVRTFSKSLSFAGMRLGFVVANPKLIDSLFTAKNSFNHFPVDSITQKAGIASTEQIDYYAQNAKLIVQERERLFDFLTQNSWSPIKSKTNFVFTKKDGRGGREIYEAVKKEGILIRHFNTSGIEDFVRISIGTKNQQDQLLRILKQL